MKSLAQLLPIILVVLLLYVLIIRPARRRANKVSQLQSALSIGDEVMLTSGIFGTVTQVEDDRIYVAVADGVVLTVHRGAFAEIVHDVPATDDAPTADAAALEVGDPDDDAGHTGTQFDADRDIDAANEHDSQVTDPSASDNTTRGAN